MVLSSTALPVICGFLLGAHPTATDGPTGTAILQEWLDDRGGGWRLDAALSSVAEEAARAAATGAGLLDARAIDARLRGQGLGDPDHVSIAVSGQTPKNASAGERPAGLWQIIDDVAGRPGFTHAGAGWASRGSQWVFVLIATRRPVEWAPVETSGSSVRFSTRPGAAVGPEGAGFEVWSLGPCGSASSCRGPLLRRTVEVRRGAIAFELQRPPGPGRWVVEVVAPPGTRDPVLGWWFFDRGEVPAFSPTHGADRWLSRLRAQARLPPLSTDLALQSAAQAHATAVCDADRATHGFGPAEDGPAARAQTAGFDGLVAENVAVARSARRAFENLLWSPSHRRTMLDPEARWVGRAVVKRDQRACIVQLFGFPDGSIPGRSMSSDRVQE